MQKNLKWFYYYCCCCCFYSRRSSGRKHFIRWQVVLVQVACCAFACFDCKICKIRPYAVHWMRLNGWHAILSKLSETLVWLTFGQMCAPSPILTENVLMFFFPSFFLLLLLFSVCTHIDVHVLFVYYTTTRNKKKEMRVLVWRSCLINCNRTDCELIWLNNSFNFIKTVEIKSCFVPNKSWKVRVYLMHCVPKWNDDLELTSYETGSKM